jgi:hypothetical protein
MLVLHRPQPAARLLGLIRFQRELFSSSAPGAPHPAGTRAVQISRLKQGSPERSSHAVKRSVAATLSRARFADQHLRAGHRCDIEASRFRPRG